MSREVTRDEVRSLNLISYVIFHRGNDDAEARLGRNEILCLFHVQGVAPGSARRPADERGEREESRERAVPAARTRAQSTEQRLLCRARMREGRCKDAEGMPRRWKLKLSTSGTQRCPIYFIREE